LREGSLSEIDRLLALAYATKRELGEPQQYEFNHTGDDRAETRIAFSLRRGSIDLPAGAGGRSGGVSAF